MNKHPQRKATAEPEEEAKKARNIDTEVGVEYRRCLFEKSGMVIIADGSDSDDLIDVEDAQGAFFVVGVDTTPQPWEGVLPASPVPAEKEHPPGLKRRG